MTIVAGISFERSAFSASLTGKAAESCGISYAFSTILGLQPLLVLATFSLTFRPESDISDSPYFRHPIHMEHFLRGGMA
jgi:hypothetical protein